MEKWQDRVVKERDELDKKIKALQEFIAGDTFEDVESAEQLRLKKQCVIMVDYRNILTMRIKNFEKD